MNSSEILLAPTSALLVAYHFPPVNVIAAQRALRIARVLLRRYERVYVLRMSTEGLAPDVFDYDYGHDVLNHSRLVLLDGTPILSRRGYSASPSIIHKLIGAVLTRLFCDPGLDWVPAVSRCLESIDEMENIGMVVASGPPFIPLVRVVRWASRRSIPVVLDYRDLWTQHPAAPYPRIARFLVNRLLERPVKRAATLMTTVSRGCREMLLSDSPAASIQILLNAPDAAYRDYFSFIAASFERPVREKEQPFRIVFTGQVYAHCTFAPLLEAMLHLPAETREQVEVHYYGGCSAMVSREFKLFGLGQHLSDHGRVSKEESIRAVLGADLLLSLIHTEKSASSPSISGLMTTKVYDYFLSGVPVLNIGPADADVNWFAKSIGSSSFYSFSADKIEQMAGFISQAVTKQIPLEKYSKPVNIPDFAAEFNHVLNLVERGSV